MSDVYKIAVSLVMQSNAPAFFSALSHKILHVHSQVKDLEGGLNRLNRIKLAIGGGLAIAGGAAGLKVLGGLVDKGNELVKVQQNMAAAGVKATEIQEAYAKAWDLTKKYQNVTASEALKIISEGRMTFGSQHEATHHAEDFVKMVSFLKAFQGGKHGGGAMEFEREAVAAMKSGEIAGKVSPKEMAEHVAQLTAMRIAYGDQLKITQYLTAQRAAGVALRNTSDNFRYGMFPALVQENGPSAGTMLMTAFNKVVAGVGNKTASLQRMAELGLLNEDQIKFDKAGRATGLKDPSAIMDNRAAAMNFGDWVMKTLKPLLDKQTTDPIRQAQLISGLFPDRNAAKAVTEILQQFTKLSKDAALMQEARKSLGEKSYIDKSWDGQKQAFHEQWENFLQALGQPLVPRATEMLRRLTGSLTEFGQWASRKENEGTIVNLAKGFGVLAAAMTGAGAVALLAAIGPAGWLAAGVIAAGTAFVAFKPQMDQWIRDTTGMGPQLDAADKAFNKFALSFGAWMKSLTLEGMDAAFNKSALSFGNWLKSWKGSMDQADTLFNKAALDFGGWIKSLKPTLDQWDKVFNDAAVAVGKEISSWPGRLAEAISAMGAAIVKAIGDKLKSLFNNPGNTGDTGNPMGDFGGGDASGKLGGNAANDNLSGSVARGMRRGGAAGGGGGGGFGGSGNISTPLPASAGLRGEVQAYLRAKAASMGIDPNVAERVMKQESGFNPYARNINSRERSYGVFQLNTMGGLGNVAQRQGIDPTDPSQWKRHIDFGLGVVKRDGWRQWYGARDVGIGRWQGIGKGPISHPAPPVSVPSVGDMPRKHPLSKEEQSRGKPVTAGPPPPSGKPVQVESIINLDGQKIAAVTSKHMAQMARFTGHVGGMDSHGSWRPPGTTQTDAA